VARWCSSVTSFGLTSQTIRPRLRSNALWQRRSIAARSCEIRTMVRPAFLNCCIWSRQRH
jgi:hypothetical protein